MQRTLLTHIEAEYLRYKTLGEGALRQLRADEMVMHAAGANSVAVIVWHLAGNLESRFTDFLTSDGEKPWRHRDSEFEPRQATPASIRKKWDRGWRLLLASLRELSDDDLGRSVTIRGSCESTRPCCAPWPTSPTTWARSSTSPSRAAATPGRA